MDYVSDKSIRVAADDVSAEAFKLYTKEVKSVVSGIREEASKFTNPKGISGYGLRLASIPGDIYNAFCKSHGRFCWQDPHFIQWFLKKYPYFKYVPSVTWTTSRF